MSRSHSTHHDDHHTYRTSIQDRYEGRQ